MRPLVALVLAACCASAADPAPAVQPGPGWLGVGLEEVGDALAYHLGLANDLGVMVERVAPGGPAAAMSLKTFDVIVAVDGVPIYTPRALQKLIAAKQSGEAVMVQVRRGEQTVDLTGMLGVRPPDLESERPRLPPGHPTLIPGGPRSGCVQQPDGSTMEWSVEEPR